MMVITSFEVTGIAKKTMTESIDHEFVICLLFRLVRKQVFAVQFFYSQ